jgi:hypothetical protein
MGVKDDATVRLPYGDYRVTLEGQFLLPVSRQVSELLHGTWVWYGSHCSGCTK